MLKTVMGVGVILFGVLHNQNAAAENFSANIGYHSEYIYRGIPQKSSSAFAGLDWTSGGFDLGAWTADVGDGLEVDLYGGYGFNVGDFGFSVGGTWYTYTGGFDDDYLELNLGANWKFISFDAAIGEYGNFDGPTQDYQFYSLTLSYNGFYGKGGTFAGDFDGSYFEAGYGNSLSAKETYLFDYVITAIYSDSTLLGGESDTNLVLTLSRSFPF